MSTPPPHQIKRYGWIPDLPDHNDKRYAHLRMALEAPAVLPPSADLTALCPPVYDQGQLGSCTANAIGGAFEFEQMRQKVAAWTPSRLFIYYNERSIEGTVPQDSGAQIRDGLTVVQTQGVPPEKDWPYDIAQFAVKPPDQAFQDALQNKATQSFRLDNTDSTQLRGCLAAGFPFVFGITVYASFESQPVAANGVVPMPKHGEKRIGGHAIMCVGYDDAKGLFKFRNSWGPGWGDQGYGYLPYYYMTSPHYASDFWTIRALD